MQFYIKKLKRFVFLDLGTFTANMMDLGTFTANVMDLSTFAANMMNLGTFSIIKWTLLFFPTSSTSIEIRRKVLFLLQPRDATYVCSNTILLKKCPK